eukprot:scaffold300_cov258-Pinguiococcus_pyrenoidosus.AAC.5
MPLGRGYASQAEYPIRASWASCGKGRVVRVGEVEQRDREAPSLPRLPLLSADPKTVGFRTMGFACAFFLAVCCIFRSVAFAACAAWL